MGKGRPRAVLSRSAHAFSSLSRCLALEHEIAGGSTPLQSSGQHPSTNDRRPAGHLHQERTDSLFLSSWEAESSAVPFFFHPPTIAPMRIIPNSQKPALMPSRLTGRTSKTYSVVRV